MGHNNATHVPMNNFLLVKKSVGQLSSPTHPSLSPPRVHIYPPLRNLSGVKHQYISSSGLCVLLNPMLCGIERIHFYSLWNRNQCFIMFWNPYIMMPQLICIRENFCNTWLCQILLIAAKHPCPPRHIYCCLNPAVEIW